MKLPDSDIPQEELESFLRDINFEFEAHQAELERTERILKRVIAGFIAGVCVLILLSLVGCGGEEPPIECREDFIGPPSPHDTRPLCPEHI
jgi:hypothetical protein